MLRNKLLLQIVWFGWLIFGVQNFALAQNSNRTENVLARFEKSIAQGEYAAIERGLLDYAIANPRDAKAFALLGNLRFAQNRFAEAKSLYQKALSLDANAAAIKISLAQTNFQLGDREQAISGLAEIAEPDAADDKLRLKLAQAFALVGDCARAVQSAEKLQAPIKNSDALALRADCYLQLKEQPKALALIAAAKIAAKQNPAAAIQFAEVLSGAALYKESADVLRAVVAAAPNNRAALVSLAKSEVYAKDFANAEIHLARAAKLKADAPDLLIAQGLLENERGNAAQAVVLLEKSLAAEPDSATALSQLVVAAMRAKQAGKAVRAAEKLLALDAAEPEFLYLHGAATLNGNNLAAAEKSLNRFAELRPQDARGCLALGLVFAAQPDKIELARAQLKKCVAANPRDFEANYQLGLSYKTAGETETAIEYLEAATKSAPGYALALRDLGAVYLQAGAEAKARVALEKSAMLDPNDADTHFQLSRLYNLSGEKDLAKKHLEIFQKLKNPVNSDKNLMR